MGKNGSQDTPSTRPTTGGRRSPVAYDQPTAACETAEAGATDDSEHEPVSAAASPRLALSLDMGRYEAMLADPALPEAERTAFLEMLWEIIVGFVDLGFHIHPVQQVEAAPRCDQTGDAAD